MILYQRKSLNFIIFGLQFLLVAFTLASNDVHEGLPYCGVSELLERFVFVSTLDGKITALNPNDGGAEMWSVHPGHEPMLSSSIHRLELTNYGQLVRMIPSLNGGLYKFNGENVEPIPLTAEHLLQASFRYSDDLVISGGKESQTVGISLQTGEVLYECSMRGCTDEGQARRAAGDVLLVQRMGQVVRAVEPRTGSERWNFSVAQHDLKLLSECHSTGPSLPRLQLKVVVPEGLVCAMDPSNPSAVLWKHKFDSPVVSAWEIQKDNVFEVDLFSRSSHLSDSSPSLYIGMHEKQLYIQESVTMLARRQELAMQYGKSQISQESGAPRLPWRPVVANARNNGLEELELGSNESDASLEEVPTTALSVLYASPYVDGMGFYLYTKEAIKAAEESLCNVTIADPSEEEVEETPVTIVIVSLWYWWREVALISITTALAFNVLFTRRFLRLRRPPPEPELPVSHSDTGEVIDGGKRNSESQSAEYVSRYLTDFDPVHFLGKGGFGVVFEAKNKVDDCHYAIKRIVLPDAPESRERVMREVRALAKLDHHHIVRYFNSWMECPPPGWQLNQDRRFVSSADMQTSGIVSETATSCFPSPSHSNIMTQSSLPTELPSYQNRNCENSDSFIVFAADSTSGESEMAKNNPVTEHSIVIEPSCSNSEKESMKTNKRRRRPKTLEWTEHSTICQSPSKVYLYIQMQLCKRESLKDWLLQNPARDYQCVMAIFEQIVKAVEYVHFHNLIHRDLKPSNIFFSMDQQIKVGDFGLVTTIVEGAGRMSPLEGGPRKGHTSQVGTQLYMSPEQLSGKPYSYKVDIFSLGLILFELLVPSSTQMERLKLLQDVKLQQFPPNFTDKYEVEHGLLQRMLSHSPDERPSTVDLLSSPPLMRDQQQGDGRMWQSEISRHRRESSRTSISSASSSDTWQEIK